MKFRSVEDGFVVRLEKGEELVKTLTEFVDDKKIEAGFIQGLGGVLKARLGYYNLTRKKYIFRSVKEAVELMSLQGNISRIGDEPALHMHAVVSDKRNKAHGGHVQEMVIGGTCEVYIKTFKERIEREVDSEIGLPLMQL